jgi:Zn-dependent protease
LFQEQLLTGLPVLILSIVVHEVAHGWAARSQGDPTAAMLGRLTLNPLVHIDPVGSILVPAMMMLMPGGVIFGWAKPVPVNPRNYRNYRRGDIIVSLAGVASNFLLVILFTLVLAATYRLSLAFPGPISVWVTVARMADTGIFLNLVLILFNLVPIPPLDGSHVFYHLLPPGLGARYRAFGQYGMILVFGFLFLGGFRLIQGPLMFLYNTATSFAALLG